MPAVGRQHPCLRDVIYELDLPLALAGERVHRFVKALDVNFTADAKRAIGRVEAAPLIPVSAGRGRIDRMRAQASRRFHMPLKTRYFELRDRSPVHRR